MSTRPGLPAERAGRSFERSGDVGGDPAAVEAAFLGDHELVVEPGGVDAAGVERDMVRERLVAARGFVVGPGDRPPAGRGVEVAGGALELAPGRAGPARYEPVDVLRRYVDGGGMAGLQHPQGELAVGERHAGELDADAAGAGVDDPRGGGAPTRFPRALSG